MLAAGFPVRSVLLAGRRLPSSRVLTQPPLCALGETGCSLSGVASHKDVNPAGSGLHPRVLSQNNYFFRVLSPGIAVRGLGLQRANLWGSPTSSPIRSIATRSRSETVLVIPKFPPCVYETYLLINLFVCFR